MSDQPPRVAKNRLRKISLDLVSLVDRPDNPTAEVTFFKMAPDSGTFADSQNPGGQVPTSTRREMGSTEPDEGAIKKGELPDGLPAEVVAYILKLEDLALESVAKAAADVEDDEDTDEDLDAQLDELSDEELEELLDAAEGDDDEDVDYEDDDDADDDDEPVEKSVEDILKSADPRVVQILKAQQLKLEQVEKQANEERDARLKVEFAKAAQAYEGLGEQVAIAKLLRAAHEGLDTNTQKILKSVLDRAAEAVQASDLFREIGRSGGEFSGSGLDAVAKRAAALVDGSGADLTPEQAFEKALELDKDAYDKFNAEFMGGKGR